MEHVCVELPLILPFWDRMDHKFAKVRFGVLSCEVVVRGMWDKSDKKLKADTLSRKAATNSSLLICPRPAVLSPKTPLPGRAPIRNASAYLMF